MIDLLHMERHLFRWRHADHLISTLIFNVWLAARGRLSVPLCWRLCKLRLASVSACLNTAACIPLCVTPHAGSATTKGQYHRHTGGSTTTQRQHHRQTAAPPPHSGSTTTKGQHHRHIAAILLPHSGNITTTQRQYHCHTAAAAAPQPNSGATATQRQHHKGTAPPQIGSTTAT